MVNVYNGLYNMNICLTEVLIHSCVSRYHIDFASRAYASISGKHGCIRRQIPWPLSDLSRLTLSQDRVTAMHAEILHFNFANVIHKIMSRKNWSMSCMPLRP